MLQANSLFVTRSGKEVLSGVSFGVNRGEVYALLGGNGAGKSTTLLSFLGFVVPSQGCVCVKGQEVSKNVMEARRAIAYLPESVSLYEHLNALENLEYFLGLAQLEVSSSTMASVLDRVALPPAAWQHKLGTYSKGMRQKVAIALAILRNSDILLLDEPTSGLDPSAIDELHLMLKGLAESGKSILMVTHDLYGACQVADHIGLLRNGVLVGEFTAEEGKRIDTEAVRKAFSVQTSATALLAIQS